MDNCSVIIVYGVVILFPLGMFFGVLYKKERAYRDAMKSIKPLEDKYKELIAKYMKKVGGSE